MRRRRPGGNVCCDTGGCSNSCREACRLRGVDPKEHVLAFQETYEKTRADLKDLAVWDWHRKLGRGNFIIYKYLC